MVVALSQGFLLEGQVEAPEDVHPNDQPGHLVQEEDEDGEGTEEHDNLHRVPVFLQSEAQRRHQTHHQPNGQLAVLVDDQPLAEGEPGAGLDGGEAMHGGVGLEGLVVDSRVTPDVLVVDAHLGGEEGQGGEEDRQPEEAEDERWRSTNLDGHLMLYL